MTVGLVAASATSARPILLVGNKVDPATPYQDAVAMSHDLADARLVTVDGYGHSALGVRGRAG